MAKRGRPHGTLRWARNPENYAAHHATVLMELWLAAAPVPAIRGMLSSLARHPEYQALIEQCWCERGDEHCRTVPPKIRRCLCVLAVAHTTELRRAAALQGREQIERRGLQMQGYTDAQIASMLSRAAPPQIEPPDVDKVLEVVKRKAPGVTLRRKAAERRKAAKQI
jgi:hypothetical protein